MPPSRVNLAIYANLAERVLQLIFEQLTRMSSSIRTDHAVGEPRQHFVERAMVDNVGTFTQMLMTVYLNWSRYAIRCIGGATTACEVLTVIQGAVAAVTDRLCDATATLCPSYMSCLRLVSKRLVGAYCESLAVILGSAATLYHIVNSTDADDGPGPGGGGSQGPGGGGGPGPGGGGDPGSGGGGPGPGDGGGGPGHGGGVGPGSGDDGDNGPASGGGGPGPGPGGGGGGIIWHASTTTTRTTSINDSTRVDDDDDYLDDSDDRASMAPLGSSGSDSDGNSGDPRNLSSTPTNRRPAVERSRIAVLHTFSSLQNRSRPFADVTRSDDEDDAERERVTRRVGI